MVFTLSVRPPAGGRGLGPFLPVQCLALWKGCWVGVHRPVKEGGRARGRLEPRFSFSRRSSFYLSSFPAALRPGQKPFPSFRSEK